MGNSSPTTWLSVFWFAYNTQHIMTWHIYNTFLNGNIFWFLCSFNDSLINIFGLWTEQDINNIMGNTEQHFHIIFKEQIILWCHCVYSLSKCSAAQSDWHQVIDSASPGYFSPWRCLVASSVSLFQIVLLLMDEMSFTEFWCTKCSHRRIL